MVTRDTKTKDSSSKVETLAKEIQRKMKDIDVTEGVNNNNNNDYNN